MRTMTIAFDGTACVMRRSPLVASLALLGLLLVACGGQPAQERGATGGAANAEITTPAKNADGYVDLTVEQLAPMMLDKDFTLVNVHVPYDGELPQTDLFIPYDQVDQHLDELPGKDAPIVIYCRSGNMSTQSAAQLAALGYTNVMELDGGFKSWRRAGYEVLNRPR